MPMGELEIERSAIDADERVGGNQAVEDFLPPNLIFKKGISFMG